MLRPSIKNTTIRATTSKNLPIPSQGDFDSAGPVASESFAIRVTPFQRYRYEICKQKHVNDYGLCFLLFRLCDSTGCRCRLAFQRVSLAERSWQSVSRPSLVPCQPRPRHRPNPASHLCKPCTEKSRDKRRRPLFQYSLDDVAHVARMLIGTNSPSGNTYASVRRSATQ